MHLKYPLALHPNLTTTPALAALLSPFGSIDTSLIVLSMKPPKKAPHKPPKHGTAFIPFTQVGAAFAAVGASGRKERGLNGIDVGWVGGKEPEVIAWLRKKGMLGGEAKVGSGKAERRDETSETSSSKDKPAFSFTNTQKPVGAYPFSSFPDSFVSGIFCSFHTRRTCSSYGTQPDTSTNAPTPPPVATPSDLDYESLTLLRMRQAERERLEREIQAQEAEEA